MLITSGFGFLLAINWAWLLLPFGIWFVSACVISWWDSHLRKKGLPDTDKTGTPWWHSAACMIAVILIIVIPLANFGLGPGPHYGVIRYDIESQFNLEHVHHQWFGSADNGEYKWVAKDPDGLFVMCNTEKTKSEDTFLLKCDSGKDYQKEGVHDFK